ncbi:MAG TPA: dienelactone hydrolase family protein [Thermoleophilia bacterium]|nr:dienelactone hydrolase family protein [Thermoleophilia bacterium]
MYLVKPETERVGGVLVLHSWWGLNGFFRDLCGRFAEQGFVALAPDLYDGRIATTIAEARELRTQATASRSEPAYRYLIRMIGELRQEVAGGVGVVGFSMGGHWACWLAQRPELPIAATVTFYAARAGDYSGSRSAFLGHFAETDEWVSAAGVKRFERSLARAGRECRLHTYEGTRHWFFEADRKDVFDAESAALAWQRTVSFLEGRLG